MVALIQRVKQASVSVRNECIASIKQGGLVFLGVAKGDSHSDVDFMIRKISGLRMFSDDQGHLNHTLGDINGALLLVSQFTLVANTNKGRRPSFENAAPPEDARIYYQEVREKLQRLGITVKSGVFGASMVVSLENDGPLTFILDSQPRKVKSRLSTTDTV